MNEQSYYNLGAVPPAPAPRVVTPPLRTSKKAVALLMLLSCILLAYSVLFGGFAAGFALCAMLCTVLYLIFAGNGKVTGYSAALLVTALLMPLPFALYRDGLVGYILFHLFFVVMAAVLIQIYNIGRYPTGSYKSILDILAIIVAYPFLAIGKAWSALFSKEKGAAPRKKGGILLGLLAALPVLLIIIPLLISADAAFEQMLGFLKNISVGKILVSMLFGGIGFLFLLYPHAYSAFTRVYSEKAPVSPQRTALPTAGLMSFTGAISLVYVLYIFSQLSYFFSAFAGKTAGTFLPAEYARRGFFEMCGICLINLVILFFVILLSRREQGKINAPIKGVSTFISLFSLLLIGTALSKMVLYINRFGLTKMRLLTSVFMVFLAGVFIILLLRLFIRRLPYFKPIVLLAAVLMLVVGFADIDSTIAHYNVSAYQSGKLSTIDTEQLFDLSESAYPHMLPLLEDKNEKIAIEVAYHLGSDYEYLKEQTEKSAENPVSFNLSTYRAYRAVKDNKAQIDRLASKSDFYADGY